MGATTEACLFCYGETITGEEEDTNKKTVSITRLCEVLKVPVAEGLGGYAIQLCLNCGTKVDTLSNMLVQLTALMEEIDIIRQTLTNDLSNEMNEDRFKELNAIRQLIMTQITGLNGQGQRTPSPSRSPVQNFIYVDHNAIEPVDIKQENMDTEQDLDPDWAPHHSSSDSEQEDPFLDPPYESKTKTKKCSVVLEKIDEVPRRRSKRKRRSKYSRNDSDEESPASQTSSNACLRARRLKKLLKRAGIKEHRPFGSSEDVHVEAELINDEEGMKIESKPAAANRCPYENCTKSFHKPRTLEFHVKRVHEGCEQPYSCSSCECSFQVYGQLVTHRKDKHPPPTNLNCPECGKTFAKELSLKNHLEKEACKVELPCGSWVDRTDGVRKFVCGVCSHRNKTRFSLSLHIRKHTGEKRFICELCSAGFNQSMLLKHHQAAHHPESIAGIESDGKAHNPNKCETCGKVFASPSALKGHQLLHTQEYPFFCPVCGLGATCQIKLKLHMVVHSEERSFACDQCSQTFKRVDKLRRHKTTVHEALRPFQCHYCPKNFADRFGLQRHIKIMHEKDEIKPFSCVPCGQDFALKDYLIVHQKTKKHKELMAILRTEPKDAGSTEPANMILGN